ncbi:MAG TPA: hypothetical protein VMR31_07835 [Myxococcota bacterium]|nr:hypothetical protein [Myxococcota bacterium]
MVAARKEVKGAPPRAGDLWLDLDPEGCGIVVISRPDEARGFAILIRHLQALPAREVHSDFYLELGGRGRFFR